MNIAILPARSGSKRIKNKNFKLFAGQPMISYPINIAKKSGLFEKIFISSDNPKIKHKYKKFGATDFILRPRRLSDDHTVTKPVIEHAIKQIRKSEIKIDNVCCIYPCTPFLNVKVLKNSLKLLNKNKKKFVFPIMKYGHPIQRSFSINKKDKIIFREPKFELTKTQNLKSFFHDAGQFYWASSHTWLKKINMHSNSYGYDITDQLSIDIDNPEDWSLAEKIYISLNYVKKV